MPRQHNRLVLPMIDALLRAARVEQTFDSMQSHSDAVPVRSPACASPPPLRRASVSALGIPVVPVSSLAALAQTAMAMRSGCAMRAGDDPVAPRRDLLRRLRMRRGPLAIGAVPDAHHDRTRLAARHRFDVGGWSATASRTSRRRLAERGCCVDATLLPTRARCSCCAHAAIANGDVARERRCVAGVPAGNATVAQTRRLDALDDRCCCMRVDGRLQSSANVMPRYGAVC